MSKFLTIGDICNITTGSLDSNAFVENGKYPFYTCAKEPIKIDSYAFDDDVVLVAGNNAKGNFHVNRFKGKFNAYQRTYILTSKGEKSIDYIYYLLSLALKLLKDKSQGSQTKFLTIGILKDIHVPNLANSHIIAKVLSDIDAKIELNNKINRELEAMAKTLYDYWFVQFDFPCLPTDYSPAHAGSFSGASKPNNFNSLMTYNKVGGLPVPDGNQWFVYVILCEDDSFYKGITNDLYRSFYEHYTGQGAKWTQTHKPKKIIHWEAFTSQNEASKREEELKTEFGRTWLQTEYEKLVKYGHQSTDGLPAHQTRLMPAGKMVYNAELKREIPDGWEVKKLGEMIDIQRGISYKSSEITGGIPMISLNSFNLNGTYKAGGIKTYSGKYTEKQIAKSDDLLIASTDVTRNADIIGKAIMVPHYYKDDLVFSMDIAKIVPKKEISSQYLMMLFNSNHYHNYIKWYASGTIVLHLNMDGVKWYKAEIPQIDLIKKFDLFYLPIANRINETERQNQQLSELRDWLLPMLMNGQVTVRQAHGNAVNV